MKRVLSLLLLIPFLTVQAWALRGGPYDSMVSRSAYAGTYGVAFSGTSVVSDTDPDQFLKNANGQEAVGVMTLSVPSSGAASGRVLIFNAGLMYLGNAQGTLNAGDMTQKGKAKMTLLQQMSHYTARTASDGLQKQGGVVVDLILSGPLTLELATNYYTGLIEVSGTGKLYKFAPMITEAKLTTSNVVTQDSVVTGQSLVVGTNQTRTVTTVDPDGSTVTTTESTTTTGPASTTSGNTTTTGGTQTSTFEPDKVRQPPVTASQVFMNLTAVGVREDTAVAATAPFTVPTEETFFQIDIPAATTGGGGGTGGTTA